MTKELSTIQSAWLSRIHGAEADETVYHLLHGCYAIARCDEPSTRERDALVFFLTMLTDAHGAAVEYAYLRGAAPAEA